MSKVKVKIDNLDNGSSSRKVKALRYTTKLRKEWFKLANKTSNDSQKPNKNLKENDNSINRISKTK